MQSHFDSIEKYFVHYAEILQKAMHTIDFTTLKQAVALIEKTMLDRGVIYSFGNGGSSAIANHLQCDFGNGMANGTSLVPKIVSLSSCDPVLTAIANDIGYENIFAHQLGLYLEPKDLVVAISSSGNSPNIIKALQCTRNKGAKSILLCGFEAAKGKFLADVSVHYRIDNYGIVEDLHQMTMHIIAQYLHKKYTTEEILER